jgi:hypothetical protein
VIAGLFHLASFSTSSQDRKTSAQAQTGLARPNKPPGIYQMADFQQPEFIRTIESSETA